MRSRYAAFVVRDAAYLLQTWAPATRPAAIDFDAEQQWTGLEIVDVTDGSPFHTDGTVEFRAHYTIDGHPAVHHETSTFTRASGEWLYVSALPDHPTTSAGPTRPDPFRR